MLTSLIFRTISTAFTAMRSHLPWRIDGDRSISHLDIYGVELLNFVEPDYVLEVPTDQQVCACYCCNCNMAGIIAVIVG